MIYEELSLQTLRQKIKDIDNRENADIANIEAKLITSANFRDVIEEVSETKSGLMKSADYNKLNGIANGAEKNIQSDWAETDETADAYIQNKPGDADSSKAGFMSIADKIKLDNIEAQANKTIVDASLSSTSTNPVQNKAINTALANKVDKVSGKGLSTNDYTTDDKNKLNNITNGAEINQNAFSHITNGTKTISATTKTDTFTLKQGEGISLNYDTANKQITINSNVATVSSSNNGLMTTALFDKLNNIQNGANHIDVDSVLNNTSTNPVQNKTINTALSNKVDKDGSKVLSDNNYTTTEKNKLSGIATGAEVNQNAFSFIGSNNETPEITANNKQTMLRVIGNGATSVTYKDDEKKITISSTDEKVKQEYIDKNHALYDYNYSILMSTPTYNYQYEIAYQSTLTFNPYNSELKIGAGSGKIGKFTTSGSTLSIVSCKQINDQGASIILDNVLFGTTIQRRYIRMVGIIDAYNDNTTIRNPNNLIVSCNLIPTKQKFGNYSTSMPNLGDSDNKWNNLYIDNIYAESLNLNINSQNTAITYTEDNLNKILQFNMNPESQLSTGENFIYQFYAQNYNTATIKVNTVESTSIFGTLHNSNADYAEMFEWEDGNTNNEDRVGYMVTLINGKITFANENDDILGVVSANPAVVTNIAQEYINKYEYDEYGRVIIDENNQPIISENYDKNLPYQTREERKEWDSIGVIGILYVRDDGTCKVGEYCKPFKNGIVTGTKDRYRTYKKIINVKNYEVLERTGKNVVKIFFNR